MGGISWVRVLCADLNIAALRASEITPAGMPVVVEKANRCLAHKKQDNYSLQTLNQRVLKNNINTDFGRKGHCRVRYNAAKAGVNRYFVI